MILKEEFWIEVNASNSLKQGLKGREREGNFGDSQRSCWVRFKNFGFGACIGLTKGSINRA